MSCDRYQSLWVPFIKSLSAFWPDYLYAEPTLVSDTVNGCIDGVTIISSVDKSWTTRLRRVLEQTKHENVLLLLEDYLFTFPIPNSFPEYCLSIMDRFSANKISIHRPRLSLYRLITVSNELALYKFHNHSDYQTTVQLSFWKKDWLQWLVGTGDYSPWEFETVVNKKIIGSDNKVYLIATQNDLHIHAVEKGDLQPAAQSFCRRYFL